MVEKRFIPIFDEPDKRVVGAKDNGVIISFMDMFDLLNELAEENTRLKQQIKEYSNMKGDLIRVNTRLVRRLAEFNINYEDIIGD